MIQPSGPRPFTGALQRHRVLAAVLYFLSGFVPRSRRKVLFGAWIGRKFADNPKYLLLDLVRDNPGLDLIWIGDRSLRACLPRDSGIRFLERGSIRAYFAMATAGSCFVTHSVQDLGMFNLTRGARRVYLGHGLAIKHMGSKVGTRRNPLAARAQRLLRHPYGFTHYVASSQAHRLKLLTENSTWNIAPSQVVDCGQPRIDFLLRNRTPDRREACRARLGAQCRFPAGRRIVSYLPTFRDSGAEVFSFLTLCPAMRSRLEQLLSRHEAILVEKCHFTDAVAGARSRDAGSEAIIPLHGAMDVDTQELLLCSDVLVTDYSGCFVDFLVMQRPVIHFAYDRQQYESRERGLYFSLDAIAGGPVVTDFESLMHSLEEALAAPEASVRRRGPDAAALVEWERGNACEYLRRKLLGVPARLGSNSTPSAPGDQNPNGLVPDNRPLLPA